MSEKVDFNEELRKIRDAADVIERSSRVAQNEAYVIAVRSREFLLYGFYDADVNAMKYRAKTLRKMVTDIVENLDVLGYQMSAL